MDTNCIETAFDYIRGDSAATFTSGEKRWINRILKYADAYPDDVKIMHRPEDNDGHIVAHVPAAWLKVSPPRTVNLSDEQRAERAARMRNTRNNQN